LLSKKRRGKRRKKLNLELMYVSFAVAIVYKQAGLFQKPILNYLIRIAYYFHLFFGV